MGTPSPTPGEQESLGLDRVATGAAVGLAAAILAIVLPVAFLLVATYSPGGFLALNQSSFITATAIFLLAGALLFLFSLFLYRRGFSHLRKVDSRFTVASLLCLVGTLGFLLVLIAAVVILGSENSLVSCINGHPTHALTCLRSGEPLGAYTGLAGFWLGWLGGVGIVLGLWAGASRVHSRSIGLGAVLYAVLLLALIGPFVSLVVAFPGVEYMLLLVPILSVLAPYFVFHGSRAFAL
jgi:hypothetical protein